MALRTLSGKHADPRKGRGAGVNPEGRFEQVGREAFDDGWATGAEDEPVALKTVVTGELAKSIIAHNESPDIPFSQSINPYQGCEHGCIYCYARPSHAYRNLSPGIDFETRIFAKTNAAELLRRELSRPGYRCELLALGANTDPYQPAERSRGITRGILEVCAEFNQPVGIVTKNALVERDIDRSGQQLIAPEVELEGWTTSLSAEQFNADKIIALYADHGTHEQIHSEFKTDLDIERLPSGKFATNDLVMACAVLAYNILRWIGLEGLTGIDAPIRHEAKRRRLRTVMQELMYVAARVVSSGRRLALKFSAACPAFPSFEAVYAKLAAG